MKEIAEERDKAEIRESFERDCEKEYQSLVSEYQSIVEVIKNNDYSDRFRFRYVEKLNDLLGLQRYKTSGGWNGYYSTVRNCISDQSFKESEDLKILRQKAYENTYAKWSK